MMTKSAIKEYILGLCIVGIIAFGWSIIVIVFTVLATEGIYGLFSFIYKLIVYPFGGV